MIHKLRQKFQEFFAQNRCVIIFQIYSHLKARLLFYQPYFCQTDLSLSKDDRVNLRKAVKKLLGQTPNISNSQVVHHFLAECYARFNIFETLHLVRQGLPFHNKPRTGRPRVLGTQKIGWFKKDRF